MYQVRRVPIPTPTKGHDTCCADDRTRSPYRFNHLSSAALTKLAAFSNYCFRDAAGLPLRNNRPYRNVEKASLKRYKKTTFVCESINVSRVWRTEQWLRYRVYVTESISSTFFSRLSFVIISVPMIVVSRVKPAMQMLAVTQSQISVIKSLIAEIECIWSATGNKCGEGLPYVFVTESVH